MDLTEVGEAEEAPSEATLQGRKVHGTERRDKTSMIVAEDVDLDEGAYRQH